MVYWETKQVGRNSKIDLLSERGTDIMTPFPVPIHNLLTEIIREVMRTNENPNFPVPTKTSHYIIFIMVCKEIDITRS